MAFCALIMPRRPDIAFLTESEPPRGVDLAVQPGVRRIVANNPGPMTYYGTNTYLVHGDGGVLIIDPGPDLPEHVDAILRHAGGPICGIGVTHGHSDHVGATAALVAATGAPTYGFHPSCDSGFVPDVQLKDQDSFAGMRVIHTPGHAPDHVCFASPDDSILFAGDHVMAWSTTFIGAPVGRMADYLASLRRLMTCDAGLYLPGHGPPLKNPHRYIEYTLAGRLKREAQILTYLRQHGQARMTDMLAAIYPKVTEPRTRTAAERTLLAHLLKLKDEGLVVDDAMGWAPRKGSAQQRTASILPDLLSDQRCLDGDSGDQTSSDSM